MHRPLVIPSKVSSNSRRPEPSSSELGATGNSAHVAAHSRTYKPIARHRSQSEAVKPKVSTDFLNCLNTFTKRDFEHASDSNLDAASTYVPPVRPMIRKVGPTENVKFLAQPITVIPSSQANSRPSTSSKVQFQSNRSEGYSVMEDRPSTVATSSGDVLIGRALKKSKISPARITFPSEKKIFQAIRPATATATTSDCSINSGSDSERPNTANSTKRVTFAADVINYDRESKPSKRRKMPKRRRQGFPHPSRGIFVPQEMEILESSGPSGICRNNPYLNFNQVWTHPSARSSSESMVNHRVRQERFHSLMSDLEHAHVQYNRLASNQQNDYLRQAIFKRYILVVDLALTEGHLHQVEHLLETVSKSIPVLQQNSYLSLYDSGDAVDGFEPKGRPASASCEEEHPDLILTGYALSRISGRLPRHDSTEMSIETVLVKLCLELIEVVFSPLGSSTYTNALNTLPHTVERATSLLKDLRNANNVYNYIKWINNSAVQRDFRSILKNFDLLDKYGCKSEISTTESANKGRKSTAVNTTNGNGKQSVIRPRTSAS